LPLPRQRAGGCPGQRAVGPSGPHGRKLLPPGDIGCPNAAQFVGLPSLNDRGQVAFNVFLTGGGSRSGIFRRDGATTIPIALDGTGKKGAAGQ
jgi:hypothetical protein